jgi:hypothetical protein
MAWLQAIFNLSSDSIGAEAYWAFVLVTCQDTESVQCFNSTQLRLIILRPTHQQEHRLFADHEPSVEGIHSVTKMEGQYNIMIGDISMNFGVH